MKNLTLSNITRVTGGTYHGPEEILNKEVTSITTDSRTTEPGCLFVAIVGERVDAHKYIPQVMKNGALASVSEKELPDADFPYIKVESSLKAVKDIARFYREELGIPVVGITGSVGKTSTKEVIASVLSEKYRTLKTLGNFNNELGLPLTIFRLREEDEIAVLEMGISEFGEMSRLTDIAKPDTCVITNIGTCHLENLGDRDGVLKAKTEIFSGMKPGGSVVLNGDDDKLIRLGTSGRPSDEEFTGSFSGDKAAGPSCDSEAAGSRRDDDASTDPAGADPDHDNAAIPCGDGNVSDICRVLRERDLHPVFFGLTSGRDLWADEIESHGLKGITCRIHFQDTSFKVNIPMPGRHMIYNALAATAIGRIYHLTDEEIKRGIENLKPLAGRFNMIETDHYLIVDDCYNANPMSMKASLDILKDADGRKVAILGDMGELGENEAALHSEVGHYAAAAEVDLFVCTGALSKHMAEAIRQDAPKMQVIWEPDRKSLLSHLADYVKEGDTILVKASRFMKFEEVVDFLKNM